MRAYCVVRHPKRYPYGFLGTRTHSHHLHYPRFVRVANGKRLTFRAISVFVHKSCHDMYGFSCCLATLQCYVHQRTVIKDSRCVNHLRTSSVRGFSNGDLIFIDVSNDIIGLFRLRYLSMIFLRVPIKYLTHLSFCVLRGRIMT